MSTSRNTSRSSCPPSLCALALACLVAAGSFAAGCDDDPKATGAGGSNGVAGSSGLGGGTGLGGAGGGADAAGGAGGGAAVAPSVLAILNGDYVSTSVSLYAPATGTLVDGCAKSGVTSATLLQALSGNVTLPTQPQAGGKLVLLDGTSSVLTFVDPATCAATAQLSVATAGFKANPHDIVTLSSTKAYVTRYETNAAPTASLTDFDEGDDLLIVNPTLLTVTGRIALGAYATPGPAGAPTQARPDRALLAGGLVYVTLNSIDSTFGVIGAGRIVIVDPTTDAVAGMIDLPNQKDCSGLSYISATKKLYVACGGAYTDAMQVAESALVEIDLSGPTPVIGRMVQAATLGAGTDALNFFYAVVSGDTAFVGTMGAFPATGFAGTPDAFYAVSLITGVATKLASDDAGNLGSAIVDAATSRVFLPDASATAPLVRVFDISGVTPTALTGFEPNPSTHLPPRSLAGL